MTFAPIALFVYNRPEHTRKTVEALQKNEGASESDLFIFSDGPKKEGDEKVAEVREYIKNISGFKNIHVICRDRNYGLADSIISGVSEVVNHYGRIIVMEDDLITVPFFLKYMNEALDKYEACEKVFSVTGYSLFPNGSAKLPETFFIHSMSSWTWATWKDKWALFDPNATGWEELLTDKRLARKFDHKYFGLTAMMKAQMIDHTINSWAVRWDYSAFKNQGLSLFPNLSLVTNTGFDGSGTHYTSNEARSESSIKTAEKPITFFSDTIEETDITYREINKHYRKIKNKHYRERLFYYITHLSHIPAKVLRTVNARR